MQNTLFNHASERVVCGALPDQGQAMGARAFGGALNGVLGAWCVIVVNLFAYAHSLKDRLCQRQGNRALEGSMWG